MIEQKKGQTLPRTDIPVLKGYAYAQSRLFTENMWVVGEFDHGDFFVREG